MWFGNCRCADLFPLASRRCLDNVICFLMFLMPMYSLEKNVMKNVCFNCSICRSHAVACVNQFIISRTQALMLHIDSFIEVSVHSWLGGLSQITYDLSGALNNVSQPPLPPNSILLASYS